MIDNDRRDPYIPFGSHASAPKPHAPTLLTTTDRMLTAINEADKSSGWNRGGVPIAISATISIGGVIVR